MKITHEKSMKLLQEQTPTKTQSQETQPTRHARTETPRNTNTTRHNHKCNKQNADTNLGTTIHRQSFAFLANCPFHIGVTICKSQTDMHQPYADQRTKQTNTPTQDKRDTHFLDRNRLSGDKPCAEGLRLWPPSNGWNWK